MYLDPAHCGFGCLLSAALLGVGCMYAYERFAVVFGGDVDDDDDDDDE